MLISWEDRKCSLKGFKKIWMVLKKIVGLEKTLKTLQAKCLDKCSKVGGATGCEMINFAPVNCSFCFDRVSRHEHRPPVGLGALDHLAEKSAHRACGGESRVAAAFRGAAGGIDGRLRPARQAAGAAAFARSSCRGLHGTRLELSATAPVDSHLARLSLEFLHG